MKKNISLCCRGGGIKSASSAGVIKALEEMGYTISKISGTGMASVVAGLYALDFSADQILDHLTANIEAYCDASLKMGGSGSLKVLETTINEKTGWKTFCECKIPLTISASTGNIVSPKPIVFSSQTFPSLTIGKACRASCSTPFYYEKFHLDYGGKIYDLLDGCLTLDPIVEKDENDIAVLSTFYRRTDKKEKHFLSHSAAWKQAEKKADLIIKPIIPYGILGSAYDIKEAFMAGYNETLLMEKEIDSLVRN